MSNYKDLKHKNLVDKGTIGTTLAVGTTAQRGSTTGQFRFNSTTGKFEGRDANVFTTIEPYPTVASVGLANITEDQITANYDLVITGTNFFTGAVATFIGNDGTSYVSPTTTLNSITQITARVPTTVTNANEPFDVKIANSNNLAGTLTNAFNVNAKPVWTTAVGTVATIADSHTGTHATLAATDSEGDTIAYTETGATNITGAGLSLNSSTGAITGDPTDVGASTTVSFTGRATAGGQTTDRSFNIIVIPSFNGSTSSLAAGSPSQIKAVLGTTPPTGVYWYTNAGYNSGTAFQAWTDWSVNSNTGYMILTQSAVNGSVVNSYTTEGTASSSVSGTRGAASTFREPTTNILSTWSGDTNSKCIVGQFSQSGTGSSLSGHTDLNWIVFDVTPLVFRNMFDNVPSGGEFTGTISSRSAGGTGNFYWSKHGHSEFNAHLQMSNTQSNTGWNGNNYMEMRNSGGDANHSFFVKGDGTGGYFGGTFGTSYNRYGFWGFAPNNQR